MSLKNHASRVCEAPTNPGGTAETPFDVADLYCGPMATASADGEAGGPLDEKLRQVYF
jgi:hypothetical protein